MTETTTPDDKLLSSWEDDIRDALSDADGKRWICANDALNALMEHVRAGQSHAARLLEALEWYADPANYRTFHDEDGDESIPCIPCDLTPADEEGLRLSVYDCGDRARAAIAAAKGADQ